MRWIYVKDKPLIILGYLTQPEIGLDYQQSVAINRYHWFQSPKCEYCPVYAPWHSCISTLLMCEHSRTAIHGRCILEFLGNSLTQTNQT